MRDLFFIEARRLASETGMMKSYDSELHTLAQKLYDNGFEVPELYCILL